MRLIGNDFGGLVDQALADLPGTARLPYFRRRLWERDGGKCGICGAPVPLGEMQADHIIPVSLGGAHHFDNLRPAHRRCNAGRGNGHVQRTSADPNGIVSISVRIPNTILDVLAAVAQREDRSLNAQIVRCLRECAARYGAAPEKPAG